MWPHSTTVFLLLFNLSCKPYNVSIASLKAPHSAHSNSRLSLGNDRRPLNRHQFLHHNNNTSRRIKYVVINTRWLSLSSLAGNNFGLRHAVMQSPAE
ncbi:unnamed protein product [Ceratitis capitata]|uniref:(Mediterranean fruit fly) hypothetical protein n=1 Tax=Ceratitis capitata TaxID=7213 RepID=A0A811UKC4_CERCA|nr:unnamed protein product [Ceratitis capitata]